LSHSATRVFDGALLTSTRTRLAIVAAAVALLWLAVLWAVA